MASILSQRLQAMAPRYVAPVREWIGSPTYRGSRLCVRLARLVDGRLVWATWGTDGGEPCYFWGPVHPADCGVRPEERWQRVSAAGSYCARLGHVLTLGVDDTGSLPDSEFITRDVRPRPTGERFATVWAHSAHRIVSPATAEDVRERTTDG